MSTINSSQPSYYLLQKGHIYSESLDVIISTIHKYSENHVISGEVSRLYLGVAENLFDQYKVERVQAGLLRYDPIMRAHLFVIWGYLPDQINIVSCAYYLYRRDEEGAFTRLRCVKPIGV